MTKSEIITAIAEKTGQTKIATDLFLDAFQDVVTEALAKGEKVQLVGFGTFEVVDTKEKEVMVNPKQPELGKKTMPAGKKPKFKAGKSLKDAVK